MGTWSDSGSLWLLLSDCLRLDRPLLSIELECAPGVNWWLLSPCLSFGAWWGMGNFGCEATPWVEFLGNELRFRVSGRIPSFWESQLPALAGTGLGAQLLLVSSLRQTCFSVTVVSSALEAWLPLGVWVESVQLWILFNLPTDRQFGLSSWWLRWFGNNLVDPASSHMLVSKIKPCMSQYKLLYGETANGSLKQL